MNKDMLWKALNHMHPTQVEFLNFAFYWRSNKPNNFEDYCSRNIINTHLEKAGSYLEWGSSYLEKAGSYLEKAGSYLEKAGSYLEKTGSYLEKAGSYVEKAGSF